MNRLNTYFLHEKKPFNSQEALIDMRNMQYIAFDIWEMKKLSVIWQKPSQRGLF